MSKKDWMIALGFGTIQAMVLMALDSNRHGISFISVSINLVLGLFGGVIFVRGMRLLRKSVGKGLIIKPNAGEQTLKSGPANHFLGRESVGGQMLMTTGRLVFKSHNFNVQNHQISYDLDQIKRIKLTRVLGFLDNGFIIDLTDGHRHKFVVDDPKEWVGLLQKHTATPM